MISVEPAREFSSRPLHHIATIKRLSAILEQEYTVLGEAYGDRFARFRVAMVRMLNGYQDGAGDRRHRFDVFTFSSAATLPSGVPRRSCYSGRLLVLGAGLIILVLWGSLYLVFRDWRARYQGRAAFGATQVAPVIDALGQIVPHGMDAETWRETVQQTHDMLVAVTSANLLDLEQMKALREELLQAVARASAHPETSRDELAGIWNAMADRAGFILQQGTSGRRKGHPRPVTLPPRSLKGTVVETGKL